MTVCSVAIIAAGCSGPGETMSELARQGQSAVEERCTVCHQRAAAPDLDGIVGQPAGAGTYDYSEAFRNAEFVWTEEMLDKFLADPSALVPGNSMAFYGLEDAELRRSIIAYLVERSR